MAPGGSRGRLALLVVAVAVLASCSRGTAPPPEQPSPTGATAEATAPNEELTQIADSYGIVDPPLVGLVRYVSQSESAMTRAACLTAAGFPATVTGDGTGWQAETTAEQADALGLAEYTCAAQYPVDPDQMGPLSDDQKQVVARYLLESLPACLEDRGFSVADVPSRATFVAGFDTTPPWNPYTDLLPLLGAQEGEDLMGACPPNTPPDQLYGR